MQDLEQCTAEIKLPPLHSKMLHISWQYLNSWKIPQYVIAACRQIFHPLTGCQITSDRSSGDWRPLYSNAQCADSDHVFVKYLKMHSSELRKLKLFEMIVKHGTLEPLHMEFARTHFLLHYQHIVHSFTLLGPSHRFVLALNCSYCINWDFTKVAIWTHVQFLCELILYFCCISIELSLYLHGCIYCVIWEIRGSIVNATDSSRASQSVQIICQALIGPQMIDFDSNWSPRDWFQRIFNPQLVPRW